ncbi:Uncharacterized protein TCM_036985 [Theobroma cacao]|uniref:Uncharacterized protein n=1 Tax=Theobroma cacao TaxID=3641 RepID=A0A061GJW7_THECC|nr:Uncharacterized protein TCM_036985 [Theobroma cacao]
MTTAQGKFLPQLLFLPFDFKQLFILEIKGLRKKGRKKLDEKEWRAGSDSHGTLDAAIWSRLQLNEAQQQVKQSPWLKGQYYKP